MIAEFFEYLDHIDNVLWVYIGFPAILLVGLYLSVQSRFVQVRHFPHVCRIFFRFLFRRDKEATTRENPGVNPMTAFFAGLGGCVGIGNVVAITTAVQIGGPGAVFWMWVAAIVGSLVKYAEVYLGFRFRILKDDKSFSGGPMHFLEKAFSPVASTIFCLLMCVYGVEIFQFSVVTNSIAHNFDLDKTLVTLAVLALVVFAELGGMKRVGTISTAIIPLFIVLYLGLGSYVLFSSLHLLPEVLTSIFSAAFTPMAALGSFAGSSLLIAITQGIRRGCYSSDIGIGYASIMHSASRVKNPAQQASLVIFDVFLDAFIVCTTSVLLVLVTGTWKENIMPMHLVQEALAQYYPYMHYFMPFFLFLLGYNTVITYFSAGIKTAEHIGPKYGRAIYYVYSVVVLFIFSYVETTEALIVMSTVQVLLLALNLAGIMRLRKEIRFDFAPNAPAKAVELEALRVG